MKSDLIPRDRPGDLTRYRPDKGLQTIAVAEAAEKHFARAKDAKRLIEAIEAKLKAQAEFIYWWDSKGFNKPGSPFLIDRKGMKAGHGGMPESQTLHRWRKKLNDPDDYERTKAQAIAKYPKILEFESIAHVGHNSGENEWYTPEAYIAAARVVLGDIDLDPASNDAANAVVQAGQIFTPDDRALEQPWHGRVWMNPPYAQPFITQFCEKLAASVTAGTVSAAVVLVNNATETQWFRALVDVSAAICFPTGRVRFWHPDKESATPLQGQAVIYIGDHVAVFHDAFRAFGFLTTVHP